MIATEADHRARADRAVCRSPRRRGPRGAPPPRPPLRSLRARVKSPAAKLPAGAKRARDGEAFLGAPPRCGGSNARGSEAGRERLTLVLRPRDGRQRSSARSPRPRWPWLGAEAAVAANRSGYGRSVIPAIHYANKPAEESDKTAAEFFPTPSARTRVSQVPISIATARLGPSRRRLPVVPVLNERLPPRP